MKPESGHWCDSGLYVGLWGLSGATAKWLFSTDVEGADQIN